MSKSANIIVWTLLIVGVMGLFVFDLPSNSTYFRAYKIAIELYLFGFTSFLILKRVFFYRFKGNVDVIRLVTKSSFQISLLWQGIVLALLYLVYNQYFYGDLLHFNTIMIAVLLLYYLVQVILNANPSIYIDEQSFSYDDFFVSRMDWQDVQRIEVEEQYLKLKGQTIDFELDFDLVDDIDYIKLNDEVQNNVLDGDLASENASKTLVEIVQTYANLYNVRLINSAKRII